MADLKRILIIQEKDDGTLIVSNTKIVFWIKEGANTTKKAYALLLKDGYSKGVAELAYHDTYYSSSIEKVRNMTCAEANDALQIWLKRFSRIYYDYGGERYIVKENGVTYYNRFINTQTKTEK